MRKIVAGLMVSADGVAEAPEKWTGPHFTPEIGQLIGSQAAASDMLLLGRVTYETFRASFEHADAGDPMAARLNAKPKAVVSTTLTAAGWANSTLIRSPEQITELKEQPGRNITVSGSISLVRWLLRERLLDELDLLVFPVIVGGGHQLLGNIGDQVALRLASSEAFSSGVLRAVYHVA